jgi:hypothetical protein
MIDVALSILALIAGGLTLELFSTPRPLKQPGFQLGVQAEEFQSGNPS